MISKSLLLALLSLIVYTTMALRLSFTSLTVKRSKVRLFAERGADFIKAVKKSTASATLLAVGMFAGVMPGYAYVLDGPFNSIVVPSFQSKITLSPFAVKFDCPDDGSTATATVRQNALSQTKKVTYTPSGGQAKEYVDGTDLFCKTKQIDVIATAVGLQLKLITGEITPNAPYSGPLKGSVIYDLTGVDNNSRFRTLEDAQAKCSAETECAGVEFENDGVNDFDSFGGPYSTRKGRGDIKLVKSSLTTESAFAKIGKPDSVDSMPWKINIKNADWTISK